MKPGNVSYLDHIFRWLDALIVLSLGYELYRATVMAGTSPYDSLGETALGVIDWFEDLA